MPGSGDDFEAFPTASTPDGWLQSAIVNLLRYHAEDGRRGFMLVGYVTHRGAVASSH
jgi:hypothetical protein